LCKRRRRAQSAERHDNRCRCRCQYLVHHALLGSGKAESYHGGRSSSPKP
jgi:hypothetical protein